MHKIGSSGYWTLTLTLPEGEHRYSYQVQNGEQMADPTVTTRERDDYGGENTVIVVGGENVPVS
jgi:1,4-alpha-glucan branching enzyme